MESIYAHIFKKNYLHINQILIVTLYVCPSDTKPYHNWKDNINILNNKISDFHTKQFKTLSQLKSSCFGPIVLSHPTAHYTGSLYTSYEYVEQFKHEAYQWINANKPLILNQEAPNLIIFQICAEWGLLECKSHPEEFKKTILYRQGKGVSHIQRFHGSCGMTDIPFDWNGEEIQCGMSIISEDIWKYADLPGSAIAVYHETIGHSLGIPHPANPKKNGVMGFAMYSGKSLEDENIELEAELKKFVLHEG